MVGMETLASECTVTTKHQIQTFLANFSALLTISCQRAIVWMLISCLAACTELCTFSWLGTPQVIASY